MVEVRRSKYFGIKLFTVYCHQCKALVKTNCGWWHWTARVGALNAKANHLASQHSSETIFKRYPVLEKSKLSKDLK